MNKLITIALMLAITLSTYPQTDTPGSGLLSLSDFILLAQQQSPSVQSARNTFLSAYWNHRYAVFNFLIINNKNFLIGNLAAF